MKEKIRQALLEAGAIAVGFAAAGEIDPSVALKYEKWIGEGFNGEMEYLKRHIPLRRHTDNVLPEAKTVISLAFSYVPEIWRDPKLPSLSAYAYGEDYHIVLRDILRPVVKDLKNQFGGKWRICIDSAPVEERFWAVMAGIGFIGLNGAIITQKAGSLCFLVEIISTLSIQPDNPCLDSCISCGKCLEACPGKALFGDGTMDARRCINYLTIEKKTSLNPEEKAFLEAYPAIKGCDRCLRVCPHNQNLAPSSIPRFHPPREANP